MTHSPSRSSFVAFVVLGCAPGGSSELVGADTKGLAAHQSSKIPFPCGIPGDGFYLAIPVAKNRSRCCSHPLRISQWQWSSHSIPLSGDTEGFCTRRASAPCSSSLQALNTRFSQPFKLAFTPHFTKPTKTPLSPRSPMTPHPISQVVQDEGLSVWFDEYSKKGA